MRFLENCQKRADHLLDLQDGDVYSIIHIFFSFVMTFCSNHFGKRKQIAKIRIMEY